MTVAKARKRKRGKKGMKGVLAGKGFPTLGDLEKTIPKGGLLAPSLRKDVGKIPGLA